MSSNRPLTPEKVREQMEWMNKPEERKRAQEAQDALGALNESTRPLSASSSAAFEAKEQEEQKVNDKAMADLIKEDLTKGIPSELKTKDTANAHTIKNKVNYISHGNHIIKSNLPRPEQGPGACLATLHPQVTESVLSPYLGYGRDHTSLSTSCVTLYTQTEKTRQRRAFLAYIRAMLHDHYYAVSRILDSYPKFLLAKPKNYDMTEIQSHYTWLRYLPKDESVFSMAQKLQLIDVVRAIFPHYLKELQDAQNREDKPRITELENAWVMQVSTIEKQKALQEKYTDELILPVIKALAADTTIQVDWAQNSETGLFEATIKNASEATLTALETLRDKLFKPKSLKKCIDVDQLLIAVYNAYDTKFDTFQNWAERDAYAVLVIGLIQSLADPRLGKIFSQGLSEVVNNNKQISDRAQLLKLADGRPYYRSREDSARGLGFTFLCSIFGWGATGGVGAGRWRSRDVEKLCQAKATECVELTQRVQQHCRQTATQRSA